MTPGDVQTVQVGDHTLTLRGIGPQDSAAVVALHNLVFGPEADQRWFAWKYGTAPLQGCGQASGVWHGDALIAYCGGLPRPLWQQGQRVNGMQIGDVMVAPSWRGILTRRGPFFHASQHFYANNLGASAAHQVAYGFPSERHLRLAVMLELLWSGGPVHALTWNTHNATQPHRPAGWSSVWRELNPADPSFDATVDQAWSNMQPACADLTLGQRDAAYLRWRYVERPAATPPRYRFFALHRRWSPRKAGIAVMGAQGPQAMWLDWIGAPELLPRAARACQWQAATSGATTLSLWASPLVAQCLQATGVENNHVTAWLGIPRASTIQPQQFEAMNWWLMGGDTDFL